MKAKVLRDELYMKFGDSTFATEVLAILPCRIENTLQNYRIKLLGRIPQAREDFDPSSISTGLAPGDNVIILDSSKDLPERWREHDLQDVLGATGRDPAEAEVFL